MNIKSIIFTSLAFTCGITIASEEQKKVNVKDSLLKHYRQIHEDTLKAKQKAKEAYEQHVSSHDLEIRFIDRLLASNVLTPEDKEKPEEVKKYNNRQAEEAFTNHVLPKIALSMERETVDFGISMILNCLNGLANSPETINDLQDCHSEVKKVFKKNELKRKRKATRSLHPNIKEAIKKGKQELDTIVEEIAQQHAS